MAFRAEEAAKQGFENAKTYLVARQFTPAQREKATHALQHVLATCGPVVDAYPTWHPLVSGHDDRYPVTRPNKDCGYSGLDHTICFAHGFITCPYGDGRDVIESASRVRSTGVASIEVEELDALLYNEGTKAILVRCDWSDTLDEGRTIPKRLAVPLMLEKEMPAWRWAERAESWETMRPYLLGSPHGSRSSLFVTQDTALAMKKAYMTMVESGMFGPLKL